MHTHKIAYKNDIFSNLSYLHQKLQTPLQLIERFLSLLDNTHLDTQQENLVNSIQSSTLELVEVIEEEMLLANTSLEIAALERVFILKGEIGELLKVFEIQARENDIQFLVNSDDRIGSELIANGNLLLHIIHLLLENTIHLTSKGYVKFEVKLMAKDSAVEIIQFQITNTGRGLRKKELQTIFESNITSPYYFFNYIQQQLATLGSKLFIQSELNLGTRITFTMTLKKNNIKQNDVQHVELSKPLENLHILLVEDIEINQILALNVLEKWGARVSIVDDGTKAVDTIKDASQNIDLILMDIQLPTMNGFEATKIIRTEVKSKIPIIALTSNTKKEDKEHSFSVGMNDFVNKPFNASELLDKILHLVGRKKQANPNVNIPIYTTHTTPIRAAFDLTKLRKMCEQNEKMLQGMLEAFVIKTPQTLRQLNESFEQRDLMQVASTANRLKTAVDLMDIYEIIGEVRQLEACVNMKEDYAELSERIKRVSSICINVVEQIKQDILFKK